VQIHGVMIQRVLQASVVGFLFALAGCSSTSDDDSTGAGATGGTGGSTGGTGGSSGMSSGGTAGGGTSGTGSAMCAATITANTANNYTFSSTLTINVTPVAPSSDLKFDWSGVTTDLLGHPVNMSDIGMLEIGLWKNLTLAQYEKKLNDDTLAQSDLAIIALIPTTPGVTTGDIYQLVPAGGMVGTAPYTKAQIDPFLDINTYPPATNLYTAMVANGTDVGQGTRMIQGFQLDASSTNTQVNVTSTSTALSMTADLHSLTSPTVPMGNPALTVDWTNMTTTAAGLPFDPTQITELRVGKYAITPTAMEMQSNFLNLDTIATTMYRAAVTAGTTFDLSQAKDMVSGASFPGIDATSTWIVALNCGDCANPAPWYMTVLKPCAQ
jgi:hypothetical protein